MREIHFYRTSNGECPVEKFLDDLGPKQAQKVAWVLRAVKELGMVPRQYFKKLDGTNDIWEVRADFGNNAYRLLGFWDAGKLVILTNAFSKKTQKTPSREIEIAEQRKRDYFNRKAK